MVATLTAPPQSVPQPTRQLRQREKLAVIDCDIHAAMPNDATLYKYLSARWRRHHEQFGMRGHIGGAYPRAVPNAARVDSWPPSGLPAGGDLPFMQEQLLDAWNIEYGVMTPLFGAGGMLNLEYGAALASAINDWQIAEWVEQDSRLRASALVAYEDGELAAQEIDLALSRCSWSCARASRWATANIGRCMKRPVATICRLRSTLAAQGVARSRGRAGQATTLKTTAVCRRLFTPRSSAWSQKGSLSASPR
jgi:hypothetical protein